MNLVSIIIPVYNMENEIESSIESILVQTYSNLQIILVNDGSTDKTIDKCNKLAQLDDRITVITTENQGSGPARNTGINKASGKYLYFPDADDYLEKNAIEVLVNAAEKNNADLVVFGFKFVGISGDLLKTKKYAYKCQNAYNIRQNYKEYYNFKEAFSIQGAPWNKFFRFDVVRKFNIQFPALRRHQDEAFIARYMDKAEKVLFIPEVLYTYYVNDLKKQWDKYPLDYIEAVCGLYEDRKHNILKWNNNDIKTHEIVENEFICNFIKALELSFSPKFKFNHMQRLKWIKSVIKKYQLKQVKSSNNTGIYQKTIKWLSDNGCCKFLYIILYLKVIYEKYR